jgi:uncharacterized damage-inducible protein DinB
LAVNQVHVFGTFCRGGKNALSRKRVAPDVAASVASGASEKIMSRVPPWFERKFDFSFPVELYPNLAVRLRGTPARLEETLRGPAKEVLVRKENGKWSAQEHAGHLVDLEPLWLARLGDFATGGKELTAADLRNQKTHEANHNARSLDELLADFRAARQELVNRAASIHPDMLTRTMLHPRMKTPMRLVDHLYFVAEHDDHHLAHIWELIHKDSKAN